MLVYSCDETPLPRARLARKKPAAAMILFHPFFLRKATDLLAGLPVEQANEAVGVG